jgi:hypothetical protein
VSQWTELERDLGQWLSSFAGAGIEFRNSNQAIIGFPYNGFKSDGMLTDGSVLIAVEIETKQTHPDTNVGKYWLLHDEFKDYKKIVLFHIYTPVFDSYEWRMRLGEFYAKKMKAEVPVEYLELDYRSAQDYDTALAEIKTRLEHAIRRELGTIGAGQEK